MQDVLSESERVCVCVRERRGCVCVRREGGREGGRGGREGGREGEKDREHIFTLSAVGVPYDGVSIQQDVLSVHLSLTVILTIFSLAGIVFSVVCLVFNFYYRNQT